MSTTNQWEGVLTHVDKKGNQQIFPRVVTDPTLSVGGKPADAAAVGVMFQKSLTKPKIVTQEQFNNMSEEERSKGVVIISDTNSDALTAANILYTGSREGLGNTMESAIDAVDLKVEDIQTQVDTNTTDIGELNKKLSVCPQKTFSNWESLLNSLNNGITIFRPNDLKTLSPVSGTMDDWGTVTIIKAGHIHETSIIWHSVNVPNNYTREVYIGVFDGTQVSWDKLN